MPCYHSFQRPCSNYYQWWESSSLQSSHGWIFFISLQSQLFIHCSRVAFPDHPIWSKCFLNFLHDTTSSIFTMFQSLFIYCLPVPRLQSLRGLRRGLFFSLFYLQPLVQCKTSIRNSIHIYLWQEGRKQEGRHLFTFHFLNPTFNLTV